MAEAKAAGDNGDNSMRINHAHLPVGEIGIFKVTIPIVQVGDGKLPHLGILCGVHGDETASLLISHLLLKHLSNLEVRGMISIITAANPFAQATNSRVSVIDFYDLNRTGAGKPDGIFTERLAYKLIEFVFNNCTHVIDLHEFEMDTPPMAIYIPSSDEAVDKKILQMIAVFNPTIVWSMDLSMPDEVKYRGSLLSALISNGVPGFAIETSRLCTVSWQDIESVVKGLVNVGKLLGIVDGEYEYTCPMAYRRNVKYSDCAGIWMPEKTLMSQVSKGDKIGTIIGLDLTSQREVFSPVEGVLIQIRKIELVQTGFNLFAIGEIDASVHKKFRFC